MIHRAPIRPVGRAIVGIYQVLTRKFRVQFNSVNASLLPLVEDVMRSINGPVGGVRLVEDDVAVEPSIGY